MTRIERVALHSKQERAHIRSGTPVVSDLKEGVAELRSVAGTGLVEFVRHNGVLHKKVLDKMTSHSKSNIWYQPTLENSWVTFNAANNVAEYLIDDNGFVHLRGILKDGSSANTDMFSLPQGFRPALGEVFAGASSSGLAGIAADADGDVRAYTGGSTTWTSIDGITFEGGY